MALQVRLSRFRPTHRTFQPRAGLCQPPEDPAWHSRGLRAAIGASLTSAMHAGTREKLSSEPIRWCLELLRRAQPATLMRPKHGRSGYSLAAARRCCWCVCACLMASAANSTPELSQVDPENPARGLSCERLKVISYQSASETRSLGAYGEH